MDANNFREFGRATIDYIVDYLENIRDRDVLPSVQPGYLHKLLPEEAPRKGEHWKTVFEDIERVIMPGVTHWQSPNFHAYYPTATSYPSIVAEMLSASLGVVGFSWICSPACTELEAIVMDWVAKLLNLPKHFLHSAEGPGGGVIQGSASEAILVAVLTAREQTVKRLLREHPEMTEAEARGKLIAYSSDQSNSCVEKAGLLAAVPIRLLKTGKDFIFHGETLQKAVEEDIANGKVPIICITTLGTTGTCAFDDVSELADACQKHNIWLHVDAAYAGVALVLPEYKHLLRGLDKVDSINYNLHKTMMVNFDCCAMWLRNAEQVMDSFSVDRIYLKHNFEGQSWAPDYRHWQIPLGRRFRALKVWITLRTIGLEGIQEHVRQRICLANRFKALVLADPRFELVTEATLGLVCFRLKGENHLTKSLLDLLTERKKIYLIQAAHEGRNFLRFVICGLSPKEKDVDFAWKEITEQAKLLLLTENQISDEILTNGLKKTLTTMTEELKNNLVLNGVEKTK